MVHNKEKILVICRYDNSPCNGQIAKTKDVCEFLKKHDFSVDVLDYGKMNAFQKIFQSKRIIKKYEKIVLMPGGKKALFFYTKIIHKLKKKSPHYVAIGGWILSLLNDNKNKKIFELLKKFKGVYLQNKNTVNAFKNVGFQNVYYISSFSSKIPLTDDEMKTRANYYLNQKEFKFCFFARVERTKGVLLACQAMIKIKKERPNLPIILDIFGEIKDKTLEVELFKICKENGFISYKGILNDQNAIRTLSTYYCMLFPTFYKGEGTPHTIIESYMAGLPVIASNWAYNKEVIKDAQTGLIFELNSDDLYNKIVWAIENPKSIALFSKNCFEESEKYNINILLKPLLINLK